MRPIFDGVSAYVDVTLTGNVDASAPFRAKLVAKGAKVTVNICPTTTHVIFRAADAARGVALHRKLAEMKLASKVKVVSPLWITNSERRGEMMDAKDFATTPRGVPSKYSTTPKRNVTPKNASRSGTKKRDRECLESVDLMKYDSDVRRMAEIAAELDAERARARRRSTTATRRRRRRSRRRCERRPRRRKDARSSLVSAMKTSRRRRIRTAREVT
jgi:hypothetical protein